MADKIYRLKHPSEDFKGFFVVDFFGGIGSTSNKKDADLLVERGCTLIEDVDNMAGVGQPAPVTDTPKADEAEYTAPVEVKVEITEPPPKSKPGRKPKPK